MLYVIFENKLMQLIKNLFLEKYYDEIGNNGIENLDIVCGVN
jgi:hypothetical protein